MTIRTLHIDEQRGWRGGEQQAAYLMNALASQGHPTFLACRHNSAFFEDGRISSKVTTVPLPIRNELDLYSAWKLAQVVKNQEINVIHAHTSHAHSIACLARSMAGRASVLVSRRVDFSPRRGRINAFKYNLPDGYVAISKKIAEVLSNFGIVEEKISQVYSAIEPGRFEGESISRESLALPSEGALVGNVAALVDHKDQETLIRAMPRVLESRPDAHLVIAGEGRLRGDLEDQIRALDLIEHVHLLGYRNDIPALLKSLDVFVMSSKEEGLCTSILDAMASGIPVAATAGGGIPEIVRHERTGLLAPVGDNRMLADHIVRLLENPTLCQSLSEEASDMIGGEFTVDKMVQGNIAVYEKLISMAKTS